MKMVLAVLSFSCGLTLAVFSQVAGETNDRSLSSVGQLVEDLYSPDPSVVTGAQEKLMKMSHRSVENRGEIVRRLVEVLDEPRAQQVAYSNAWYASAELLGNLKATEAIDALVRHLDYTNGIVGLSTAHIPAVRALIKIGKPTIPALSIALSDVSPSIRSLAARALGDIGGHEAVSALENAAKSERDDDVKFNIAKALQTVRR
jgi:HEAT repeat protein